jgi:hypothetical protein
MAVRKCPKCAAVWQTDLPKCAFCGVEGEEQAPPASYPRLIAKAAELAPQAEAERDPLAVALADPPLPPPAEPAPDPPAAALEPPTAPEPAPKPVAVEPPPLREEKRAVAVRPSPPRPPAPSLPSATAPLVFALLGVAAAIVLPWAVFGAAGRTAPVLGYLAGAVLLPFAPAAWWAGRHYEDRCAALGYRPAGSGRTGRLLGLVATSALALEGSALAFLQAISRLSG